MKFGSFAVALLGLIFLPAAPCSAGEQDPGTVEQSKPRQAPKEAEVAITSVLKAIEQNDYEAFCAVGTEEFRKEIPAEVFRSVSGEVGPLLAKGYEVEFLTSLSQQGFSIFLWKVSPLGAPDQFIARIVMQGDKAVGIWLN
jgi:hypothetical protein